MSALRGSGARQAGLLLGAAAVLAPAAGMAQNAALKGDEILVTADRLNRPAQDTPVFLTVFEADDIERRRIIRTDDIANLVPNFVVDDRFSTLTTSGTFRGLSQIDNGDPPYAVVVDGIPLALQREFNFALFDVEQIEVASGPQGALYGRNAVAGAVIINTRDASETWTGGFNASYGVGNQLRGSASISGPLNDRVAVRLAAVGLHDNGRLENTFTGSNADFVDHDFTIRAGLDIAATDWLELDLRGQYRDFEAGSLLNSLILSDDPNDYVQPASDRLGVSTGHVANVTFRVTADLPFGELVSVSGFSDQTEVSDGDFDFSNPVDTPFQRIQFLRSDEQTFSQEIRFSSQLNERVTWFVGGRFLRTEIDNPVLLPFFDIPGPISDFDESLCATPEEVADPGFDFSNFCFDQDLETVTNSFGVFGQAQIALTERLGLGLALRYDEDDREQTNFIDNVVQQETFNGFQPSVRLSYDMGDQLYYVSWGRAFLPGGFNTPPIEGFEEQVVDTLEIGTKTQWFDNRLTLNGTFFYSFVDGYQFFTLNPEAQIIDNIDEVEIFGVEVQGRAQLTDGFSVYAALGTTSTDIESNPSEPSTVGNDVPRALDYTLNLGLDVNQPIADDMALVGSIGYERRGDRVWDISNVFVQEPVDILNVRLGIDRGPYNVSFFGRNLTDEEFFADLFPPNGLFLNPVGFRNRPREYGVEFSARF